MSHANIGEMNIRFPKAIHDNIIVGNLVVHKYGPEQLWLASKDAPMYLSTNIPWKIPWKNNEVGLVLKIDEWYEHTHTHDSQDKFIRVMISSGIGYCFGSDVNVIA